MLYLWFFSYRKPEVSNGYYDLSLVTLSDSTQVQTQVQTQVHFGGGKAK
ncbi:hypothetical protein ACCAA_350050 [Candidatus Accumulibacter aalborgensis]|uniref:Uncharacterized protein n=1 Tax=Candidatus Accumulibacter aalborgensis TaxID=1860102 RepID=A0A1A8XRQ3_9PROT|nr:hypothetical protein ACCAA_350050 [Candidatus Accumulibacter aalborgensis]